MGRRLRIPGVGLLAGVLASGCVPMRPADVASGPPARSPSDAPPRDDVVPEGWLGGTREVVIDAPVDVVMGIVSDPEAYRHLLVRVRSLSVLGTAEDGSTLVAVEQGTDLAHGSYVARFQPIDGGVRFELDPSFPHDIAAARAWIRLRPAPGGGTVATFHVAFELGGPVRLLFGSRVERAALSTPDRLRERAEAAARALGAM